MIMSYRKHADHLISLIKRKQTLIPAIISLFYKRSLTDVIRKAYRLILEDGLIEFVRVAKNLYLDQRYKDYNLWAKRFASPSKSELPAITESITRFSFFPKFAFILLPDQPPDSPLAKRTIKSINFQIYNHWRIISIQPASSRLDDVLSATADCDYIAFVHAGDEFSPLALFHVAKIIQKQHLPHLIYSDEDCISANYNFINPHFKPDWDPELFLTSNYLGASCFFLRQKMITLPTLDAANISYLTSSFVFRNLESGEPLHVAHIPYVLYHSSVASNPNLQKLSHYPAQSLLAIQTYLVDYAKKFCIENDGTDIKHIHHPIPSPPPLISIIIPTRNGLDLMQQCINSIQNLTCYDNYEIIIIDNQSDDPETLRYLHSLQANRSARIIKYDFAFNYSAINNLAVRHCSGEILCFLNNDIEVINEHWLTEMTSLAVRTDIGAVGALLYFPDDTIQHAGVIIGMSGCADHWYSGVSRYSPDFPERLRHVQSVSAVTGACMVLRREIFEEVGGFNEDQLPVAFNDIDLCLKLKEKGYRNLFTPHAELYHHESATRGRDDSPEKIRRLSREIAYMRERWGSYMHNDPTFNPNLSLFSKIPTQCSSPRTPHVK